MLFSYNWLQEFIQGKLENPEKLAELLAFHAFEVESVEKKGIDWLLDVAILPQRGDCLSHQGLAREIAAITGLKLNVLEIPPVKIQKGDLPILKISMPASKYVSRYSALVVEGITIGPSPQWLKERLDLLGINSINNIVDITNLVMLEMGQPLHAFDFQKIAGSKMTIRESRAGERLTLLDDAELILPKGALVIEDRKELIDLAGIKGGKTSSISESTKNIIFQAAVFDRQKIYQTRKAVQYSTTASDMYSHGVDSSIAEKALDRAFFYLTKFGGGKPVQRIDRYPAKKPQKTVAFSQKRVEKLLGISIPEAKIKSILSQLGFAFSGAKVKIPSWRQDIAIPEDLVEEVGRIYGYENIKPVFPTLPITPLEENEKLSVRDRVKDALREAGCTEVYSYSFIGEKDLTMFQYTPQEKANLVELENPFSEDIKYLKINGIDNLLKIISLNHKNYEKKDIKIFEIGTEFSKTPKGILEQEYIAGIIAPGTESIEKAYAHVKGIVDLLLERNGILGVWYDDFEQSPETPKISTWDVVRSAEIKIGEDDIGFINGAVSPRVLSALEIERPVIAFEIDFATLFSHIVKEKEYKPPSKFPAVLRDISLSVPFQTKAQDVYTIIRRAGGDLAADIDLFDVYEGTELPEGKKGLAFHIVFQSKERTLTNTEVDILEQKIILALKANSQWEMRS